MATSREWESRESPPDWVYVNNFVNATKPVAIELLAGQAPKFFPERARRPYRERFRSAKQLNGRGRLWVKTRRRVQRSDVSFRRVRTWATRPGARLNHLADAPASG